MRLSAALTQRARAHRKIAGAKVEGRAVLVDVPREWIACRVVPQPSPESEDAGHGRRVIVERAQIVLAPTDESGEPTDVRASDRIEVEGRGVFNVTAAPQAATGRRMVALVLDAARLAEPVRETL